MALLHGGPGASQSFDLRDPADKVGDPLTPPMEHALREALEHGDRVFTTPAQRGYGLGPDTPAVTANTLRALQRRGLAQVTKTSTRYIKWGRRGNEGSTYHAEFDGKLTERGREVALKLQKETS